MTTTPNDILRTVREFITSTFYVGADLEFRDDTSLLEHGIVDSTGVLEIVGYLESTFHFKVRDDDVVPGNLDSVARIAAFVARQSALA